jgi:nucleotidyltransferase-like protein
MADLPNDVEAIAILGLGWLVNSHRVEATAIDERGYPLRMVVGDPRAFAFIRRGRQLKRIVSL